jgi:hypothetical protein
MTADVIIVIAVACAGVYLMLPRMRKSTMWRATLTPLASIIGSGFLISAPILARIVGTRAILAMTGLIVGAYLVGGAIRFNIKYVEPKGEAGQLTGIVAALESLSRYALAAAYVISVTYYLSVLSIFLLKGFGIHNQLFARIITTSILLALAAFGRWRGLDMLEKIEDGAATINLSIIVGLLAGLAYKNIHLTLNGNWKLPHLEPDMGLHTVRILLGLLIVVQGFETSRFLGSKYSAQQRIQTMKAAQIISGIIYICFFAMITVLFGTPVKGHGITLIIDASAVVACILPILLTITAVCSQFSASVADDAGGGGLLSEITHGRLSMKNSYVVMSVGAICLTWLTHIFQIISIASRAFALFYAIQCLIAFFTACKHKEVSFRAERVVLFFFLFICCSLVVVFGISAE